MEGNVDWSHIMDATSISSTSPTNVSPHKCTSCARTYTAKRSLLRHRRSSMRCSSGAHPIVRHFCDYCSDTFARPDNVQKHIRRAHFSLQEALSSLSSGAQDLLTSDTGISISPQSQGSSLGSTVGSPVWPSTPAAQDLLSGHHHVSCWTDWSTEAFLDTNSATPERTTSSGDIDAWLQDADIFGQHGISTEYDSGGSLEKTNQRWFCNGSVLGPPNTGLSPGATTQDVGNIVNSVTASENLPDPLSTYALQDAVCLAEQDQTQAIQTLLQQNTSLSASNGTVVSATETCPDSLHLHQNEEPCPRSNPTCLRSTVPLALTVPALAGPWPHIHLLLGFGTSAKAAPLLAAAGAGDLAILELILESARIPQLASTQLDPDLRAAAFNHLQENGIDNPRTIALDRTGECVVYHAMHDEHETQLDIFHS